MFCPVLLTAAAVLAAGANLAPLATATTSYVSPHETLSAVNNGFEPANSADRSHGAYGNWPRTGTQWVELAWSQPVSLSGIAIYWFDDQQGVRVPAAARLYAQRADTWQEVEAARGIGLVRNQLNRIDFAPVVTERLKIELDGAQQYSTGILEWQVFDSGASPNFPPTVTAGHERTAVVGGTTWLSGTALDAVTPDQPLKLAWAQKSGPGHATFDQPMASETVATFDQPGDYVVSLSADDGEAVGSAEVTVHVVPAPPVVALKEAPLAPWQLGPGLWRQRARALTMTWLPHLVAKLGDSQLPEGGLQNFREAAAKLAGRPAAGHVGPPWANTYVYNTIEAIAAALLIDPDQDEAWRAVQGRLKATLDEWIPIVVAAQEPDGYLQTHTTLGDGVRWSPAQRGDHEGYLLGTLIDAAIVHARYTDGRDTRLLDAARRCADCWVKNIGPGPGQREWWDGHEGGELALYQLADYLDETAGAGTGRPYRELSAFMLACRHDGGEYDQSHVLPSRQYEAVGHSVRASYLYTAIADEVRVSADPAYHGAALSLFDNLVNRKMYVTGGIGSGETSEGFGADWSLGNNAYAESCAGCGMVFWQQSMQRTYGDGRYADIAELALYNNVLGAVDLPARTFTYTNALETGDQRYDWHGCPCCVGNIPRVLLELPRWLYTRDDKMGLYVNHYVASTIDAGAIEGTPVRITQETDYPWSGTVALTLSPRRAQRFALRLRLPNPGSTELYRSTPPPATEPVRLAVNGTALTAPVDQGYAVIDRTWSPGDTVLLQLPMEVSRVHSDERVRANAGRVALRRGPLLYNVESVDQPLDKQLARDSGLVAEWRPDFLDGVTVITGQWADGQRLLAIPNYARLNRGGRTMVWMSEAP